MCDLTNKQKGGAYFILALVVAAALGLSSCRVMINGNDRDHDDRNDYGRGKKRHTYLPVLRIQESGDQQHSIQLGKTLC